MSSVVIVVVLLVFVFQRFLNKRNVQYFTLAALYLFNISRMILVSFNYKVFNGSTMYFQGYLYGSTQGVVISRINNIYHKAIILITSLFLRYGVITLVVDRTRWNAVTLLRQIAIDIFLIFMFYSNDKTEKDVFQNFFENRDELVKFKEFLAESLPQSVTVIEANTQKPLFSNNAFLNNFDHKEEETNALETDNLASSRKNNKIPLRYLRMDPSTLRDVGSQSTTDFGCYFKSEKDCVSLEEAITRLMEQDLLNENAISIAASSDLVEKHKTFEVILKKVKWDRADAIAIVLNDITYQENLIALKVANANKDQIIATVSHELRTPLHGIIGLLEISQNQVEDPEVKHHLSLCKDNANLLHSLVNSILDLQQMSTGKLQLNFAKINVRKTLNNVTQLFKFQCSEKLIELRVSIDENVPNYIMSDENRLRQILINLIGNAIKFTFEGGVTVEVSKDTEEKEYLKVSVVDTGIGIKDSDRSKLFKMYGKLEDGESVNKNGVGLGLTISNSLAGLLSGKGIENGGIKLSSTHGVGSKFTFKVHKDLKNAKNVPSEVSLDGGKQEKNAFEADMTTIRLRKDSFNQMINKKQQNDKRPLARGPTIAEDSLFCEINDELTSPLNMRAKLASYLTVNRKDTFPESQKYDIMKNITTGHFSFDERLNSPEDKVEHQISGGTQSPNGEYKRYPEKFVSDTLLPMPSGKECIIVVDDNPFNLLVAKNLIKDLGYKVKTATTGVEAIETVKMSVKEDEIVKVIFMDCQMPIMDGFETTRSLKKMMANNEIPTIPILAWTANNGEEEVRRCYECGMSGYLMKPTSQAAILRAIHQ